MKRGKKMTLTQKRMEAIQEASQRPVTRESALRNLSSCGIMTKDGKVAKPYRDVIIRRDKDDK